MPLENPPTASSARSSRSTCRNASVAARRRVLAGEARQLGVQHEDLAGPQPRLVAEELREVADPPPCGPVAEGGAEDPTGARGRSREAQEQLDGRGLARAVGPEQPDELPATDREVNAVERDGRAVPLDDAAELDDRL